MRRAKSCYWVGLVLAGAALAGCDGGDAPVSTNLASERTVSPDLAAAGAAEIPGADETAGDDLELDSGRQLFMNTCSACHGASAQGLPNQGPDLRSSQIVSRSSEAELVAIVARGRAAGEKGNTTGLPMPPRGGNGALGDRELGQIVKYLRSIQSQPRGVDVEAVRTPGVEPGAPGAVR